MLTLRTAPEPGKTGKTGFKYVAPMQGCLILPQAPHCRIRGNILPGSRHSTAAICSDGSAGCSGFPPVRLRLPTVGTRQRAQSGLRLPGKSLDLLGLAEQYAMRRSLGNRQGACMIFRTLALFGGIAGSVSLSQFPEFSQQYLQRLGGAVDELSATVEAVDKSAAETGATRGLRGSGYRPARDAPAADLAIHGRGNREAGLVRLSTRLAADYRGRGLRSGRLRVRMVSSVGCLDSRPPQDSRLIPKRLDGADDRFRIQSSGASNGAGNCRDCYCGIPVRCGDEQLLGYHVQLRHEMMRASRNCNVSRRSRKRRS